MTRPAKIGSGLLFSMASRVGAGGLTRSTIDGGGSFWPEHFFLLPNMIFFLFLLSFPLQI